MSGPKAKDGAGALPPPENAHEIFLAGDEDPLIVLDADAPPVPAPPPTRHVTAVIDDTAAPKSPPPPPRAQAEYTTDPPSIAGDRVREPFDFPPPAIPSRPKRTSPWPRRAGLVAFGVAVALAGWAAFSSLRPDPPVITSMVPSKAEPGQTVTINGTALGTQTSDVVVRFGDRRGAATSAAETSLAATVPAELANLPPGPVRVTVEVGGTPSNALFMTIARYPKIAGVEPEVALPGGEVAITGTHLDSEGAVVRIGGFPAEVLSRNPQGLRVRVPAIPVIEGRAVPVDVSLGAETARPGTLVLGHLPLVTGISPSSGEVGTTVTITGHGFAPSTGANKVTFGTLDALVLAASSSEIQAVVPAYGILESRTPLRGLVVTGGARSAPFEFTAVRPSGDVFRPRFVAAVAPGGDPGQHAVVGSELGPLLVLTGRGDAASPGERAARAASVLNGLIQQATSRPVAIEVKENPLQIASAGTTIVLVTPEDAEGLARGWEGVPKARIAAPALARYWAAVLHDYVGLFGQRTRPSRAIDVTAQARVLLDIYGDAERIGGSAGVSSRVVAGMTPDRLDALKRLAYAGPQETSGARGLALTGAWEGTLDEGGRSRPIRLEVRLDGGRLAGAMTSSAGMVAVGIPLRDLSYDKGMVRFTALLAGTALQFRGALDGATLLGTTHHADGAAATGRFALRHVE
jgi:hypothetical protein